MQRQTQHYQTVNHVLHNDQLPILEGYQFINSADNPFIMFCLPAYYEGLTNPNSVATHILNTGWKAHLSCHTDDIAALWNLVIPFLQKHQCPAFKCISQLGIEKFQHQTQHGVNRSQFTIYLLPEDVIAYKKILAELEIILAQNNIRSVLPETNKGISAELIIGKYTSVRHAGYGDPLQYISIEKALDLYLELVKKDDLIKAYNLTSALNPFDPIIEKENKKSLSLSPVQQKLMLLRRKEIAAPTPENKENIQSNTPNI